MDIAKFLAGLEAGAAAVIRTFREIAEAAAPFLAKVAKGLVDWAEMQERARAGFFLCMRRGFAPDERVFKALASGETPSASRLLRQDIERLRGSGSPVAEEYADALEQALPLVDHGAWTMALRCLMPEIEGLARRHLYRDPNFATHGAFNGLRHYFYGLFAGMPVGAQVTFLEESSLFAGEHIKLCEYIYASVPKHDKKIADLMREIGEPKPDANGAIDDKERERVRRRWHQEISRLRTGAFIRIVPNRHAVLHGIQDRWDERHLVNFLVIARTVVVIMAKHELSGLAKIEASNPDWRDLAQMRAEQREASRLMREMFRRIPRTGGTIAQSGAREPPPDIVRA